MNQDCKETYGTRLRQYKRREQMTIWVGAGIAGLIALLAADVVPDCPVVAKPLVVTLILVAGVTLAMARVSFEWRTTQIKGKIRDKEIKKEDPLPTTENWPKGAERLWRTSLWSIFLGGAFILVFAWWHPIESLFNNLEACSFSVVRSFILRLWVLVSGRLAQSIFGGHDMLMINFLVGVLASAFVAGLVYFAYWLSYKRYSAKRAYAECWWLPRWNCFRLVIRNMHDKGNLMCVCYRSWMRRVVPASPGSSVKTFVDEELSNGERIILPRGQDLPVLCFRFEDRGQQLILVRTDKRGNLLSEYVLDQEIEAITTEFSLRIQSWFLFKHEIVRMFDLPHQLTVEGKKLDLFRHHLLPLQRKDEAKVKTVFQSAQEITVSI